MSASLGREPDLAESFALAITACPDKLQLYPDASNRVELRHWDAIRSGRPYAALVADARGYRCTPLDFDASRGNAAADCRNCRQVLDYLGIRCAETTSGPGGGRHLLITWQTPVQASAVRRLAKALAPRYGALDISALTNPDTGCVRPPLAPHRSGGRSEVVGDIRSALRALEAGNSLDLFSAWLDLLGLSLLQVSPRIAALIREGDRIGRYPSVSEARIATAVGYRVAGASEQDWLEAVVRGPLTKRPDGREFADLRGEWHRSAELIFSSPTIRERQDALKRLRRMRSAVESGHGTWKGKAGATDRRVLLAHLSVAERVAKVEYDASVREIAELAGVTRRTTIKAQCRLVQRRYLKRIKVPYEPGHSARWVLRPVRDLHHTYTPPGELGVVKIPYGSDVWRWGGLGPATQHVYELLSTRADWRTSELATVLDAKPPAVRWHLRKLEAYGLASRYHGRWRFRRADLESVAAAVGSAGAGKEQKKTHAAERLRYRALIASNGPRPPTTDGRSA